MRQAGNGQLSCSQGIEGIEGIEDIARIESDKSSRAIHTIHSRDEKLDPLLKWAGGKEKELKYILPNLPDYFEDYYEPFVGGGAVYTALQAKRYFINDRSEELISLYKSISKGNNTIFFDALYAISHNWELLTLITERNERFFVDTYTTYSKNRMCDTRLEEDILKFVLKNSKKFDAMFSKAFSLDIANFRREVKVNLIRRIRRIKELEQAGSTISKEDILNNMEAAIKGAFYAHFRYIYNRANEYGIEAGHRSAIFFFIRNFAYSGMFRYNSKGEFNVPYGGIGYNRKKFCRKVDYLRSQSLSSLLNATVIENLDFEDFFKAYKPQNDGFVFLDPPYDTEFSAYAKNRFTKDDQRRLSSYLIENCQGKWMLVIKNTDFIYSLYADRGLNIRSFKKNYLVSFMNRNNKKADHLLITNY